MKIQKEEMDIIKNEFEKYIELLYSHSRLLTLGSTLKAEDIKLLEKSITHVREKLDARKDIIEEMIFDYKNILERIPGHALFIKDIEYRLKELEDVLNGVHFQLPEDQVK